MAIQAPEGTRDLLPDEARFWNKFRMIAEEIFGRCGYVTIETPIFEQTELFVRGIGEATDVVSKEMFQAVSGENMNKLISGGSIKPKSHLTLRPEGTASVVRAIIQHNLVPQGAQPAKLMYAGQMFRAERPQKGRQRQFNQIGIECMGATSPSIDAEAIIMLMRFYEAIGIPTHNMVLLINSMACKECYPVYRDLVREFIFNHKESFCEDCLNRAAINPLRAFDCKKVACTQTMQGAPKITEHLCGSCKEHYEAVTGHLDRAGIVYKQDPTLVRGLDYYTGTVFEVQVIEGLGSQNAIGGGGRYDSMSEDLGGRALSGFGFALGYERCLLTLQASGFEFPSVPSYDFFITCVDDSVRDRAFGLLQAFRDAGYKGDMDHQSRSLKSQFKLADKLHAQTVFVLGPEEVAAGAIKMRDMQSHEEKSINLEELLRSLVRYNDSLQNRSREIDGGTDEVHKCPRELKDLLKAL